MLGIIDVDTKKAQVQIDAKLKAGKQGYDNSKVWKDLHEALPDVREKRIDLAILGIPPHFRGSTQPDADLDLRLIGMSPSSSTFAVNVLS